MVTSSISESIITAAMPVIMPPTMNNPSASSYKSLAIALGPPDSQDDFPSQNPYLSHTCKGPFA